MQDKRTPIVQHDLYNFLGSDSEPTSGRLSQKWKKGQSFPLAISYRGFFLNEASTLVLADEQMLMMLASSSQTVGSQTTLPLGNLPTLRIAPLWGKGDPLILVTGVLPRLLRKTQAGSSTPLRFLSQTPLQRKNLIRAMQPSKNYVIPIRGDEDMGNSNPGPIDSVL